MEEKKFLETLKFRFEEKRAINSRYSLRAFSRDLGVSHSYLSLLFNCKRDVTKKFVYTVCQNLSFADEELLEFMTDRERNDFFIHQKEVQEKQFMLPVKNVRVEIESSKKAFKLNVKRLKGDDDSDEMYQAIIKRITDALSHMRH